VQQEEKSWLGTLALTQRIHSIGKPQLNPEWRLRDKDEIFQSWCRQQGITTVFFHGASKGNPGIARAGGLIYSFDRSTKETFCWGLG